MYDIKRSLMLAAAGGLLAAASPAGAQLACGGTVGPGGTFVLTEDLDCRDVPACATPGSCSPALTVVGNAVLDLNGKTVTCSSGDDDGILLDGAEAALRAGTVDVCDTGVRVAGAGGHAIRRVVALRSGSNGFTIASDGNQLEDTVADTSGANGYNVSGGSGNRLERAIAVRSERFNGFNVTSGAGNLLRDCVATSNAANGFNVTSTGNRVVDAVAVANGNRGINLSGNANAVRRSVVAGNAIGIDGVASGNLVQKNVVLGNGTVDMEDNPGCDDVWRRNAFGTSTPPGCVR